MSCCGHPNTCERPCFHGGKSDLDRQCDAAMARLVDDISRQCARHAISIRFAHDLAVRHMGLRHDGYEKVQEMCSPFGWFTAYKDGHLEARVIFPKLRFSEVEYRDVSIHA